MKIAVTYDESGNIFQHFGKTQQFKIFEMEDGKILDEMSLPPFDAQAAREREEKVSRWLTALSW